MRTCAVLVFCCAVSLSAAEPTPAPKLPQLWFVHIDRVEKANLPRFEELERKQVELRTAILAEHHVSLPQAWEVATESGEYLVLRPRASMAAFDAPSVVPPDVQKILDQRVYTMDDSIHATIRDHHSEIWDYDDDSSVVRLPIAAPAGARLDRFRVRAGKRDYYNKLLLKLREAASKNGKLSLFVFWPGFGDGSDVLLWTSPSKSVPSMGSLLETAFGREEAARMQQVWSESVVDLRSEAVTPRPDLTATSADRWID